MRQRKTPPEQVKDRLLILCEGIETEPNYFRGIKKDLQYARKLAATRIVIHETTINTAKELVNLALSLKKEAEKERNPFQQIWVVVDRDGYTKHPESFDRAKATGIQIAFSSTCFEFWYLLHFEYSTSGFSDCDAVIKKLKTHLPNYEKKRDHYTILKPKTEFAIGNGDKVMRHWKRVGNGAVWTYNPYSDVGELVSTLINL
jgi:RloB-like protein